MMDVYFVGFEFIKVRLPYIRLVNTGDELVMIYLLQLPVICNLQRKHV